MNLAVKHVGFGKHIYVFGDQGAIEATSGFFHVLYFFQIFFALATGITKLTTWVFSRSKPNLEDRARSPNCLLPRLAFYRRIFPVQELKIILIVMTTVDIMYIVAVTMINIFQWYLSPFQSDLGTD